MKKRTFSPNCRRAATIAALSVAAGVSAAAVAGPAAATPAHQNQKLAVVADQAVAAGIPGVIVRVDNGRGSAKTIVRQAAWTTKDHALAADDEFRMGSNTKTFTATMILQLVAEHRLALNDSIEKWLRGLVPNGQNITLRMLLNHTSGLDDIAQDPQALALMTGQVDELPTAKEVLALGTARPVQFAPGKGWAYSNTGYVALGLVLEKVTGHSVADLVQQRIARPLGLKHTYLATAVPSHRTGTLAEGYEPDAAHLAPILPPGTPAGFGFVGPTRHEHVNVTAINQSWLSAAGSIVSTASDWARFDQALMSGRLLPKAQRDEMRVVVPEDGSDGTDRSYGLGLEEVRTPCGTVWGHDGDLPGYLSENYTNLSGTRTVSILSTTHFGLMTDPKAGAAEHALATAAICTMLDQAVPAS
jgi:D-alanyl-D-alanine carboxypeptidase